MPRKNTENPMKGSVPVLEPGSSVRTSFRALAHRNFRLYILGQGVSIIGSWMQLVAMAWLVFELTGSPLWLGMTGFAGQIPALFLTPVAGCLIDTLDRRRLLFVTQTVSMVQALVLAYLTLRAEVMQAMARGGGTSFVLGLANAFDIPTRQSFLSELVGKGPDLANAIALNSSVFNGARLLGPALAGLLLAQTSPRGLLFDQRRPVIWPSWPPCAPCACRRAAFAGARPAAGRSPRGTGVCLPIPRRSAPCCC